MGPFDSVKNLNARSCNVNIKEEEKLSEKHVLSIGPSELVSTVCFSLFVWLLFNLLIM